MVMFCDRHHPQLPEEYQTKNTKKSFFVNQRIELKDKFKTGKQQVFEVK